MDDLKVRITQLVAEYLQTELSPFEAAAEIRQIVDAQFVPFAAQDGTGRANGGR